MTPTDAIEERLRRLQHRVCECAPDTPPTSIAWWQDSFNMAFVIQIKSPLVERGGVSQQWYGRTFCDALDRAEQDINRWCDNAMAEKGGGCA